MQHGFHEYPFLSCTKGRFRFECDGSRNGGKVDGRGGADQEARVARTPSLAVWFPGFAPAFWTLTWVCPAAPLSFTCWPTGLGFHLKRVPRKKIDLVAFEADG
jgi:hypothetical protein